MKNSLANLLDKLELNENNRLFLKGDDLKINSHIKNSLRYIDYDAIYILDENPLIIFKEYEDTFSSDDVKRIWNLNDVPIIFIIFSDEIQAYNSNIFDDENSFLGNFSKIISKMKIINIPMMNAINQNSSLELGLL